MPHNHWGFPLVMVHPHRLGAFKEKFPCKLGWVVPATLVHDARVICSAGWDEQSYTLGQGISASNNRRPRVLRSFML
jgi:hypothetical protein